MDISQEIVNFEAMGGRLYFSGDELRVRYPPEIGGKVKPYLENLRLYGEEVARVLRERSSGIPAPDLCPPLPDGVRLVRYTPKAPLVAIQPCSIVTDVEKFIRAYLRDMDCRLSHPENYTCESLPMILAKLAEVGLELEVGRDAQRA